jgi:hypothetical protein
MGGWLMLLVAERLGSQLAGMIGIAPAPDFTRWGYTPEQQAVLAAGETIFEPNPYGPEPTPTYAGFYTDAAQHQRLEGRSLSPARFSSSTASAIPMCRGRSACSLPPRSLLMRFRLP